MRLVELVGMILFGALLGGCASTSVTGGESIRTDGLGSDLRVFLDDSCAPQFSTRAFGVATLGEIAVGAGTVAFNSFGRFLEEAGQPDITTSNGLTSSYFYTATDEPVDFATLNPSIKCIHVVRSGFERRPENRKVDKPYSHLGLTSEPSLYALIELEPAIDRSAHFRGRLLHFEVQRFERLGGEIDRDISIAFGFGSPLTSAGENFAIGVIDLPGMERGRVLGERESNGLVTGWMNTPPKGREGEQAAFNLYVDVIESKRGNPFVADLGRVLQSDRVVRTFERELDQAVFKTERGGERSKD